MAFSEGKGVIRNCLLNLPLIGDKADFCWFLTILAVPINGIIHYPITVFVNALESFFTQVEQMGLEGEREVHCLNY